jgi:hypothetical protein
MVEREFLRELIRKTFTEWRAPASQGGQAVVTPVWLSVHDVLHTIQSHGTQLPGVGKDQINRITEDQVFDELRAMPEVRARDLNAVKEAFGWVR